MHTNVHTKIHISPYTGIQMTWFGIETNAKLPPSMQPIGYPITKNIHVMIISSVLRPVLEMQVFDVAVDAVADWAHPPLE